MIAVGCTGGIGSGKSTVGSMLACRGAVVIDTDRLAREAVEPGGPAYAGVLGRFGPEVLSDDGRVDRQALARIVFADPVARRDLESAVHPAVRDAVRAAFGRLEGDSDVVVVELPLLVESDLRGWPPFDATIVVDTPERLALDRLVRLRHMPEADAKARIASQASRGERLARADLVISNAGTITELEEAAERAWAFLEHLRLERG